MVIQAMRGSENHLFIPISINGQRESWWLVDTGAPMSTITEQAAATASLQAPAPGSNVRASVKSEGQELKVVMASDILSEGFDFGAQPLAVLRLDAVGGTGRFI
jgi:Aspartyl protease